MKTDFIELHKNKQWDDIISLFEETPNSFESNVDFNILSEAYYHKGDHKSSNTFINKSLQMVSKNNWTRSIKFENDIKLKNIEYALDELYNHLSDINYESETLIRTFIDNSMKIGEFTRSQEVNLKRGVIKNSGNSSYCIAIQCFNKVDLLEEVFNRLLICTHSGNFELVILQDMYMENDKEKYHEGWSAVRSLISSYHSALSKKFGTVTTIFNNTNFGTAPSCRKLLNYVAKVYEGFIFIEDDCLLSKDALVLTEEFINSHIDEDNNWFATCESINFDAQKYDIPKSEVDSILSNINNIDTLKDLYCKLDFVPSTCFITKSSIWNKISNIRAFIRGPESLSKYLLMSNKKTLFPLVPRASDIGMLHELGYSVKHLTLAGVKEYKNIYYLPDYEHLEIQLKLAEKKVVDSIYAETTNIFKVK